jgi:DNA-binding NarL/FixJ family response regulator
MCADNRPIRVLLADDHKIVREGLARLLQEYADIQVVGEAEDGNSAVELARQLKPNVVLMDLSLPTLSGFEATRRIVSENPGIDVIGLSAHENEEFAAALRKVGAVNYLTKSDSAEHIVDAVRACRKK